MESALGDLGEYLFHYISPVCPLHVGQQLRAVVIEIAVEKTVHEENLTDDVDQVEELTEDELGSIEIVFADGFSQIVYQFHPLHNIGFIKYFM